MKAAIALTVPALAGALLGLDALWPLSAHVVLGVLALALAAVIRTERSKL